MHNKNYISVGIDVGSAFSFMTILAPDETVILFLKLKKQKSCIP